MLAVFTAAHAYGQDRSLLVMVDESPDLAQQIHLQLPDWTIHLASPPQGESVLERIANVDSQLGPGGAALWFEESGGIVRVALLVRGDTHPRVSPLPDRATPEWSRVVALVVDGLLTDPMVTRPREPIRQVEAGGALDRPGDVHGPAPPVSVTQPDALQPGEPYYRRRPRRRSRWHTPIDRSGWMFRFGWVHTMSPRAIDGLGAYGNTESWVTPGGGLRMRLGRWVHPILRIDGIAHYAFVGFGNGHEGALGVQAIALSRTRLRMGGGIEISGLLVQEDDAAGGTWGWLGMTFGLPMEIGIEFNRKGGVFFQMGPTFTRTPYDGFAPGYVMSLEWEFN